MTKENFTEVVRARVDQLEDRNREQYNDLRERIDEVRYAQDALAGTMLARLDAHEEYHRRNEHRWGFVKLAGRYPFRFAVLAAVFAIAMNTLLPNTNAWIAHLFHWFAHTSTR